MIDVDKFLLEQKTSINQFYLKIYSATSINQYSVFKRDTVVYRFHILKTVSYSINHIIQFTKIEMKFTQERTLLKSHSRGR